MSKKKEKIGFGRCESEGCVRDATSLIRTRDVCDVHFYEFKKDNKRRIEKGKDIPDQLIKLKEE